MIITREPDTTQTFIPDACRNCPDWKKCRGTACVGETRYKVDIQVIRTFDAYESMEVKCPKNNQTLKGTFPSDIKGQIQYGGIHSILNCNIEHSWSCKCKAYAGNMMALLRRGVVLPSDGRFACPSLPDDKAVPEILEKEQWMRRCPDKAI